MGQSSHDRAQAAATAQKRPAKSADIHRSAPERHFFSDSTHSTCVTTARPAPKRVTLSSLLVAAEITALRRFGTAEFPSALGKALFQGTPAAAFPGWAPTTPIDQYQPAAGQGRTSST